VFFDAYSAVFECQHKRRVAMLHAMSPARPEQTKAMSEMGARGVLLIVEVSSTELLHEAATCGNPLSEN
jgi:hypothetical protein